jgi:hypothetical protein
MTMLVQTDKVKDLNKILDYIEEHRAKMISNGSPHENFDKLDYEIQIINTISSKYFLYLDEIAEDSVEFYREVQGLPIRKIYAHVADFILWVEDELDLKEISIEEEYGLGVFKHIIAMLYDNSLTTFDFEKIDDWITLDVLGLCKTEEKEDESNKESN